jgi:fibro-slime domain-containing protein
MARLSLIGSALTTLVVGLTLLACGGQDNSMTKPPENHNGVGGNGGAAANTDPTATGGNGFIVGSGGSGGSTSCVGTSNGCKAQVPEGCGDGINNQGGIEVCDDGNTVPGDGCNGACKVERNWDCPKDKSVGECKRQVICGDGIIGAGEVCDDKNTVDNDGCNSTCTVQDGAFTCVAGEACVRVSQCGNKRIEAGENCDDGQDVPTAGDGCSASCQLEAGWVCPKPGSACKAAPRCGDGTVSAALNEVCDDGNTEEGDGCSGNCQVKGEGCVCSPGSVCKCPTVACGNGTVEGSEACDDGNTRNDDGCSADCTVDPGYNCPFSNAPCVPDCGDGVVMAPMEQCDPGVQVANMDQACTSTCKWATGWACGGTPVTCHQTKCGDNKKEGTEGCDDGNTAPGDGCSPTCHAEPQCSSATGTCESKCGDGIVMPAQPDGPVMPGGACDDGNDVGGDGCSADCKVEEGYQCEQAAITAETMTVPMTVRDFAPGGDFEPTATGKFMAVTGLVKDTLDNEGKPAANGVFGGDGYITSAASFADWYRKGVWSKNTTLTLYSNGNGGYVNRYGANGEKWRILSGREEHWCGPVGQEVLDDAGDPMPCTYCAWDDPATPACDNIQQTECQQDPNYLECVIVNNVYHGVYLEAEFDGNPAFFPADDAPNPAPTALGQIAPPFGNWEDEPGGKKHNFSFTTEVRYWFGYVASKKYTLDFMGDDDVWVFVNRKLAVDIGGIHTPVSGTITLNANGGGTATVTQVTDCGATGGTACAKTTKTVNLGMQDGGVYEIALFQAERQTRASTYKLTLSGFNDSASSCKAICGDSVVSPGEQCDNGTDKNVGGYNNCSPDCLLGPYCGDGNPDPEEECDNGKNDAEYGATGGCGPGCKLPASCGDTVVQVSWGEECDNGPDNLASTDATEAYGGKCMANCQLGGYCGDGQINGPETCDDGANDGTYGTCTPDCTPAPKCGDGNLDADYGEECEPAMSDDPSCTAGCRVPGGCGDGKIQSPEQCDEGELFNTGEYGGCAPSCIYGPRCGDGIPNGPEECDDGILDGSYGGCTAQCQRAPYCGDSNVDVDGNEQCDHGDLNGVDNHCSEQCKDIVFIPG